MKKLSNAEDSFIDLDIPVECKEYLINEWTSDHSHIGWYTHERIMEIYDINCGSNNKEDWHCALIECRIKSDKNIITRQEIADKFRIDINDMIII